VSPDDPATWWRTASCPEDGCQVPWCKITVDEAAKSKIRATMCLESESGEGEDVVYTLLTCVPVD
jgi:hypothetical protein